jgi:hypothetical protein
MIYTRDHLPYRLFTSVFLGTLAFIFLPTVIDRVENYWYRTVPVTELVQYVSFVPQNICTGDTEQRVVTVRKVNHTVNGWPASITDEVYRFQEDLQVWAQISRDYNYEVVIGPTENDSSAYVFEHDQPMKTGRYKIESVVTLHLPQGIDRELPRLKSEEFEVLPCPAISRL